LSTKQFGRKGRERKKHGKPVHVGESAARNRKKKGF